MTTVLLIRHASVDPIGKWLASRASGVHLNAKGQMEAKELAGRLAGINIAGIYSSPLERAIETAQPLSKASGLPVHICNELTDVDYGDWTGKSFAELDHNPDWRCFNTSRTTTIIPGGEHVTQVRDRMARAAASICSQYKSSTVAIFSHCDLIRVALVHFAGKSLDSVLSFAIDPASISAVRLSSSKPQILIINDLGTRFALTSEQAEEQGFAQMDSRSAGAS